MQTAVGIANAAAVGETGLNGSQVVRTRGDKMVLSFVVLDAQNSDSTYFRKALTITPERDRLNRADQVHVISKYYNVINTKDFWKLIAVFRAERQCFHCVYFKVLCIHGTLSELTK